MPDNHQEHPYKALLKEREAIRDQLADWWQRWVAAYPIDPTGIVLYPIDDWARETAEQTATRIGSRPDYDSGEVRAVPPPPPIDALILDELKACRRLLEAMGTTLLSLGRG